MKTAIVPPVLVDMFWHGVKHFIVAALEHGNDESTIEGIYSDLIADRCGLFICTESNEYLCAAILRRFDYPNGKIVMCVSQLGGIGIDEWLNLIYVDLVQVAKSMGATDVYIHGRDGWGKKLKEYGFNKVYTTFAMKVED